VKSSYESIKQYPQYIALSEERVDNVASAEVVSKEKLFGALCMIGGALSHMLFGTIYCWGNFMSYLPPRLKFFDGLEHGGIQPDATLVFPFAFIGQCLSMPLGPLLVQRIGAKRTLLVSGWLFSLAVFASSYASSLRIFILFYSLIFGASAGIGYTAPMIAGWKWLPQSKGLVSGVVLTGYGLGGFLFNLIGTKLANPNGVDAIQGKFPDDVYQNFPVMLRTLAAIYGVITLLAALLVSEPQPVIAPPQPSPEKQTVAPTAVASSGLSVREALFTKQFWQLWFMILFSAGASLNVAAVYKRFAQNAPALHGDQFQALVGGLGALCNGSGRLIWGTLFDLFGFKTCFLALTILQSIIQIIYPYSSTSKVKVDTKHSPRISPRPPFCLQLSIKQALNLILFRNTVS